MRILTIIVLLISSSGFGQKCNYYLEYTEGRESIYNQEDTGLIKEFIDSVAKKNPEFDRDFFGHLHVGFKVSENFTAEEIMLFDRVDPFYDKKVKSAFQDLDKRHLGHLKQGVSYSVVVTVGNKKKAEQLMAGSLYYQDGYTKEAEELYLKLLPQLPHNSQVKYFLGRSMLCNGKPKGMKYIKKAASMGDIQAKVYLEHEGQK